MPRESPYAGSSDLVALGRALRELRVQRELRQEAVGFDAGVCEKYVGAIERGRLNPSFVLLLRIVRTLPVSMFELVAVYERLLAEIDPHAGRDVPACPTPEALAHLRRISAESGATNRATKARRARGRINPWT